MTSGRPCGNISSTSGANTTSTPSFSASARSRSKSRGYEAKSSAGPNCSGLTKIDTTTTSRSERARRINDRWPSWKKPIVGTNPSERPLARTAAQEPRISPA